VDGLDGRHGAPGEGLKLGVLCCYCCAAVAVCCGERS
jgi:hypothetical protein